MKSLIKKLSYIQRELKAPKNQYNSFGQYKYRNCEDILEATKPYLDDETMVTLSDEIVFVEGRFYVKATVTFYHGDHSISVSALAREVEEKKKMDAPQCTGTASSYARKYALNALYLIDDTKDSDSDEYQRLASQTSQQRSKNNQQKKTHVTKSQKITQELKELIFVLTDKFKNKEKIASVCKELGLNNVKEIYQKDDVQKKEMIEFLQGKINDQIANGTL